MAPSPCHTKAPGTPAALPQERREGGSREETLQAQHQRHKTALPAAPRAPCPDPEAPGCRRGEAVPRGPGSAGRGRAGWAPAGLTVGAVDAGVLVVAEEEAAVAPALVAAHGVDADLLAASVVVLTLVHICGKRRGERGHTWGCKGGAVGEKAVEAISSPRCRARLQKHPAAIPHHSAAWSYPPWETVTVALAPRAPSTTQSSLPAVTPLILTGTLHSTGTGLCCR